jgi:Zn finger protein HypA/HybF involved in hydrogenase expression
MHEHAICDSIIKKAKSFGKVKKMVVECGALAHLPCNELRTLLKEKCDFEVVVKETPAKVKCDNCKFEGEPKILEHAHDIAFFECPKCGKIPHLLEGDRIILKSVDIDD